MSRWPQTRHCQPSRRNTLSRIPPKFSTFSRRRRWQRVQRPPESNSGAPQPQRSEVWRMGMGMATLQLATGSVSREANKRAAGYCWSLQPVEFAASFDEFTRLRGIASHRRRETS